MILDGALDGLGLPEAAAAEIRVAQDALINGHPDRCLLMLDALDLPHDPAVACLRGLAHLKRFDLFRAESVLGDLLERQPVFAAVLGLAQVRTLQEEHEAAAELLRQALQMRPEHAGAMVALVASYAQLGRFERAEALSRRALDLHPTSAELLFGLGESLRCQDRHVEAVAVLQRLLPLDEVAEAPRVALGRSLLALERPAEARPIFEEVLRRNAESTGALAGVAEALAQEGRLGEAHGYVLRALAAAPDQAWLHLLHARMNLRAGRLAQAEQSAETAATLTDNPRDALRIAVAAAWERGDFSRAAEHAAQVLRYEPRDAPSHAALALADLLAGRVADAQGRLAPLMAGGDGCAEALLVRGALALVDGQPAAAAERFRAVVRQRADDRWAQPLLGAAYACAADPEASGERALRRALAGESVEDEDEDQTYVVEPEAPGRPPPAAALPRRPSGPIASLLEVEVNRVLAFDELPRPPRSDPPKASPSVASAAPARATLAGSLDSADPADNLTPPASADSRTPATSGGSLPRASSAGNRAPAALVGGSDPVVSVGSPDPAGSVEIPDPAASLEAAVDATSLLLTPTPSPSRGPLSERAPAEIVGRLHRLGRILHGVEGFADLAGRVERLVEAHDQPLLLGVMGPPGAGKTTFVNALIGQPLIPEHTALPHLLRYGRRPSARVVYEDGRVEPLALRALSEAEPADWPGGGEGVRCIEILMPVQELARASILDVPEQLRVTPGVAGDVDAVLWLVGADASPEGWADAVAWLDRTPTEAIAVVTRTDCVASAAAVDAQVQAARAALGERVHEVVAVSARRGLDGLQRRDVAELRASGFARLHKALARSFFQRAGVVRGAAVARQADGLARAARSRALEQMDRIEQRDRAVAALTERVTRDREAFRRDAEGPAGERLAAALDEALDVCLPELGELWAHAEGFEREHQLDLTRSRLRAGFALAVERVRDDLEARLRALFDDYFMAFEAAFPPGEQSAEAARVAGLQGILDGYRMLLLEEALGRHQAYLEAWVEQAPIDRLVAEAPAPADREALLRAVRGRGLRLDRARSPRLQDLGGPLFDGLSAFVDETAADLRVARVDLTERVLEPLGRLLDDGAR